MYTRAEKAHLVQDAIAFKKVPRVPLVSNCSQWQVMDAGMTFTEACYDWDLMLKRMGAFRPQEQRAREHVCKSGIF